MLVCPRCSLLNVDTAIQCDCGYKFTGASPQQLKAESTKAYRDAQRKALLGLLLGLPAIALAVGAVVFPTRDSSSFQELSWVAAVGGVVVVYRAFNRMVEIRKVGRNF